MSAKVEFQIDSSFYENIVSVCDKDLTNCPCTVRINDHDIEVPLLLALSCFSCLTNDINIDVTQRNFNIDVDFKHRPDDTFFSVLVDILYKRRVSLRSEDVVNLSCLGSRVGNRYFSLPLESELSRLESSLSVDNCIDLLVRKHELFHDVHQYNNEISLLSSHFESQKTRLCSIASDVTLLPVISSILSSDSLKLTDEDSLLDFVLLLCSIDREYESLFEHVRLEYCSSTRVSSFVDYLDANVDTTHHIRPITRCMSRRLREPIIPKSPKYSPTRHIKFGGIEITDEDPLKGILYHEHQKGNVVMETSSTWAGNVYDLIKADPNSCFFTKSVPNSWIQASLKGNKPFILKKYMIRGNKQRDNHHNLQTWKLEGRKESNGEWIVLDTHSNEKIKQLETKVFPVSCTDKLTSVKLTQTDKNAIGYHNLVINEFDIFGEFWT